MTPKEKQAQLDDKISSLLTRVDLLLALAVSNPSEKKELVESLREKESLDE